MTRREVAEFFGVCYDTIRNWESESRSGNGDFPLPATPPNKKQLYDRSAVESWNPNKKPAIPETPVERAIRKAVTKNGLASFGIVLK